MQIDFVIGLSLAVVIATTVGMVYAYRFVMRHIEEDTAKAQEG